MRFFVVQPLQRDVRSAIAEREQMRFEILVLREKLLAVSDVVSVEKPVRGVII